jgi:hypothetical protein
MIPSKPRLISWNPDSLDVGATKIQAAGKAVYRTVHELDDGCDRLPEARTWSGHARDAASGMFQRADTTSSHYLDYADAVARALHTGSGYIGRARINMLEEVDAIERGGELYVNDQWVVLIKPAGMSAERAGELQKEAEAAQSQVNMLVKSVDEADDWTAESLLAARAVRGAEFHAERLGPPGPLQPAPGDDVVDPSTDGGRQLQEMVRDQDNSMIVREVTESTDENENHYKTLYMVDGSKQVIKTEGGWPASAHVLPEGTIQVTQYDKAGSIASESETIHADDGTETTNVWYSDGTSVVMTRTSDGRCSGAVTTPDGRHGVLPDDFFADPLPTTAGGALTALEKQTGKGHIPGIPSLSEEALQRIGTGAKFGGPALGVATAIYNVATAETAHDVCVNAWSGTIGVVGGVGFDAALTVLQPELAPVWAGLASTTAGFGMGYLGGIVGELVCPP